jgi:hypothetical protein
MSNRFGAVRSWVLMTAGFAVLLAAADRVPALVAGTPHGARIYRSVADAERAIGAHLWVPASLPRSVEWPPCRVDTWPGPPISVVIHARGRADARDRLVLAQSIGSPAPPPAILMEPLQELTTIDVPVGRHTATLTRGLASSGRLLHDLSWIAGTRRVVIRYAGPVEELLLLAASLERTHP